MVVGLGNPGPRYAGTRHNIGFRVVDALVGRWHAAPAPAADTAATWSATAAGETVLLVQPQTFMNRSGLALVPALAAGQTEAARHLVVYDDVALPFGSLRFRISGSAGGHNGLSSIIRCLGTEAVPRLRMGVGEPAPGQDLADYVLEPFTASEQEMMEAWIDRACQGIGVFLTRGAEEAMTRFNRVGAQEGD